MARTYLGFARVMSADGVVIQHDRPALSPAY
jgi:hypothetical protein